MTFKLRSFLPLALATVASVGVAHATTTSTFTGTAYSLPCGSDGTVVSTTGLAYVTGSAATSTFTVGNFNFSSPAGGPAKGPGSYTIGGFLSSGGANVSVNSTLAAESLGDTELVFTGNTYLVNGQTYTFNHDDGMVLSVNNANVIYAPSPTVSANNSFTYSGATGVEGFTLMYGENSLAPGDLIGPFTPAAATPEPSSIVLMGSGLLGLAGAVRRRIKR